jgi:hypothetical protein
MADIEKAATLETKAVELIDQLTEGLKAVAPQMADVTLAAIRFQGVMDLISSLAFVIASGGIVYAACRGARWAHALPNDPDFKHVTMWTVPKLFAFVASCGAGVFGAIALIVNFTALFSWQMWAAIIDPRLSLALRVINKLM